MESSDVMDVTVPDGVAPGDTVLFTTPDGRELDVVVPDGLNPGDTFGVNVPPPEPAPAEEVSTALAPSQPARPKYDRDLVKKTVRTMERVQQIKEFGWLMSMLQVDQRC